MITMLLAGLAHAGPTRTLQAFEPLEELLELRLEDGRLVRDEVLPTILVGATPIYEESVGVLQSRSLDALLATFGDRGVRMCEACMVPRSVVEGGELVVQTGPIGLDEVIRLDDQIRGDGQPARSAIWIEEYPRGVSIRIVDLATGRVLFAQNVDPELEENAQTHRRYRLAAELERRARGQALTQTFADLAVFPDPHISIDWADQWGRTNSNLSGVTISVVDPVLGFGATYQRSTPLLNSLVGAKLIVSIPTAFSRVFNNSGGNVAPVDPLLTAVGIVRVPIGRSNYGAVATVSTNGTVGLGLSLMNISLVPFIP